MQQRRPTLMYRYLAIVIAACFVYPTLYFKTLRSYDVPKVNAQEISAIRARRSLNVPQNQTPLYKDPIANCVKPSIDDFPSDFMTQYQRQKRGGVIIHILIALYTFGALAVVCDDYFVASLERICHGMKLRADVAGATFMAAGSSAPEFFTSIIGVFITKGDIGLGTIVGSAVFNILFIVAICGMFAGATLKLSWWPLMRDSVCYMLSVAALVVITYDKKVHWYEGMILVIMYLMYVVIMYFNSRLETMFTNLVGQQEIKRESANEEGKSLIDNETDDDVDETGSVAEVDSVSFIGTDESSFTMPEGVIRRTLWIIFLPISCLYFITIPDCRKLRWKNWYFLSFVISVLWIAGLSYILVWMVEIIGYTLEIPDVVMGLTFVAAGSSVPDGISSLIVARQGEGDMAVSNTIGSNVFDILLCLGLPWLLQTTAVELGGVVNVISGSIIYTSISLFATVVVTVLVIMLNGWKLNKFLGVVFLFLYLAFISVATLFELNVFGDFNLPVCSN